MNTPGIKMTRILVSFGGVTFTSFRWIVTLPSCTIEARDYEQAKHLFDITEEALERR